MVKIHRQLRRQRAATSGKTGAVRGWVRFFELVDHRGRGVTVDVLRGDSDLNIAESDLTGNRINVGSASHPRATWNPPPNLGGRESDWHQKAGITSVIPPRPPNERRTRQILPSRRRQLAVVTELNRRGLMKILPGWSTTPPDRPGNIMGGDMTTMLREREIGKIAVVQGWLVYLILFRRFPMTALKEVAGAVLLFLAGIAACFVLGVM